MEISRQNYEPYFVDYLEGKLNDEQLGVLMSFLDFNPDLKEEFEDIQKMRLTPDETVFPGKDRLLKSESDLVEEDILRNFDMYCISSVEDDIAEEDEAILQGIIGENTDLKDTYMLYRSARLQPDESILYPGKARLKKRFIQGKYRIILPVAAAVAALLILLQIFSGNGPEKNSANQAFKSPATYKHHQENYSPTTKGVQSPKETPSLIKSEKSTGIFQVKKKDIQGKESQMAERSITEAESNNTREVIQLARIEPEPVSQLQGSNFQSGEIPPVSQKLRQTNRLAEHGDLTEISVDIPKVSIWMLADASVRGLNSVSEDEYYLDREKDNNGKIRRITFDSPIFGISAPVRKHEKK